MQIKAFKAILVRRINIKGCKDYKNTFAQMESDCTMRFGCKVLIKSISYSRQSNLRNCPVHVLVVFCNGGGLLFMSFYTIYVNVRVCNTRTKTLKPNLNVQSDSIRAKVFL